MRNAEKWAPSKFVLRNGWLRANADARFVAPGSWLITDLIAEAYEDALKRVSGSVLLDLGCGTVPLYSIYASQGRSVICVDWPGSLHGYLHLDCYADLNRGVPIRSESCDVVVLSDVLEHVYSYAVLLAEIRRVLSVDGRLLLNVPFLYRIHEAPYDYFRYTSFALARVLAEAGLHIEELRVIGGPPEVLTDTLAKFIAQIPVLGRFAAMALQYLVRGVLRVSAAKRGPANSASAFPLGYFVIASRSAR